jgi:hypothetical protein
MLADTRVVMPERIAAPAYSDCMGASEDVEPFFHLPFEHQ